MYLDINKGVLMKDGWYLLIGIIGVTVGSLFSDEMQKRWEK